MQTRLSLYETQVAAHRFRGPVSLPVEDLQFEDRPPTTTVSELATENCCNLLAGTNTLACLDRSVAQRRLEEAAGFARELSPADGCAATGGLPFGHGPFSVAALFRSARTSISAFVDLLVFPMVTVRARFYYIPLYVDYVRYALYANASFLADIMQVKISSVAFYTTPDNKYQVYGIRDHIFNYGLSCGASSYECGTICPVGYECQPFSAICCADSKPHMVYSHDVLGCQYKDPLYFRFGGPLHASARSFWLAHSGPETVLSPVLSCSSRLLASYRRKPAGFGRTGAFFGAVLPKDDQGRVAVVLPVGALALPIKLGQSELTVQQVVSSLRSLYRLRTGEEPVWLTPAGRKAFDEIEWR